MEASCLDKESQSTGSIYKIRINRTTELNKLKYEQSIILVINCSYFNFNYRKTSIISYRLSRVFDFIACSKDEATATSYVY